MLDASNEWKVLGEVAQFHSNGNFQLKRKYFPKNNSIEKLIIFIKSII
jgi:hypothetical protein